MEYGNASNFENMAYKPPMGQSFTIEEIWNFYCWCDLPLMLMNETLNSNNNAEFRFQGHQLNFGDEVLTTSHQMESENKISKSDMNLELLKEFEYTTETRHPEGEEKPIIVYICKHKNCNKEFTRTWNILDHARMHKGVKPYKCNFCMKQFTQKGNLRKHMKTHVMPSLEQRKRYKCEFCDSSYTERYNYKVGYALILT